jgi:hypothetical protein
MKKPIIFLGDPHVSDRQILTRVDSTPETCLVKLHWVLGVASTCGADILCTGDFFSHLLMGSEFRFAVKRMLRDAKDSGVAIWSVSGNHPGDVYDRQLSTLPSRELGQFIYDGYIDYLGCFMGRYSYYDTGEGLIAGFPAYSAAPQVEDDKLDQIIGLVCHHWVANEAFKDSLVVYPHQMKELFPSLRFMVSGHDHGYYGTIAFEGVQVIRPGSMMRTDSGVGSDRIPCVAYMDTSGVSYKQITIAHPYSSVFFVEGKGIEKESSGALDRFVALMQTGVKSSLDISDVVRDQYAVVPAESKPVVKADLVSNGFMV